ncbi:MAG: alcohol dehydrogenase [Amycolatopsis sp.]|jgi:aryl-alcohol dehydrogenase|uniref:NAD(P)-dependent alcohol dehydrogenase n=1 Tax=Amycolatopsis sp. TaxID=37632 RepID=UPI00261BB705|nr:NAD(P)-dependent alcohol dehydrogenase [Amycolatopsis sp.]MCU1682802.1 alcohol dehydrogenase [Amycolatopsis sp.]
MPLTTKAAVLRAADGPFVIEDVVLDPLGPEDLLVRIAGTGMCHTDLVARDPAFAAALLPAVLGHEGSGVVTAVGGEVTDFEVGDHVVMSFDSCGGCGLCRGGDPAYCENFLASNLSGRRRDGRPGATGSDGATVNSRWFAQSSYAGFAVATRRNAVKVDPALPLELLGPLGCGLQTGAGVVFNEMNLRPGQSVAVFGAGTVGLAAVMAAKIAGATDIVVVDTHPGRLEMAVELGATRVYPGSLELVTRILGGEPGVDHTLDTTSVPAVMAAAVQVLAPRGGAVLVGGGAGALTIRPPQLAGRRLTYVLEGSAVPQEFIPILLGHWRDGRFPFDRLIRTYPLSEINQAEADSLSGVTIKPVLIPESV